MKKLEDLNDLYSFQMKRLREIQARLYVQNGYLNLPNDANVWLFNTKEQIENKIKELKSKQNEILVKLLELNKLINYNLINLI
jgi:hypothetical protein